MIAPCHSGFDKAIQSLAQVSGLSGIVRIRVRPFGDLKEKPAKGGNMALCYRSDSIQTTQDI
ncbi:hypothetical protein TOC8172_50840 [Pseudomonas syringae]